MGLLNEQQTAFEHLQLTRNNTDGAHAQLATRHPRDAWETMSSTWVMIAESVPQLREAAVQAMIRAQQEKGKPQDKPPSLEERISSKPAGALCMTILPIP